LIATACPVRRSTLAMVNQVPKVSRSVGHTLCRLFQSFLHLQLCQPACPSLFACTIPMQCCLVYRVSGSAEPSIFAFPRSVIIAWAPTLDHRCVWWTPIWPAQTVGYQGCIQIDLPRGFGCRNANAVRYRCRCRCSRS
jgi:hypothetical protein